jgi:hypothetical protein
MKKIILLLLGVMLFLTNCNSGNSSVTNISDEDVQKVKKLRSDMNKFPVMDFEVREIDFGTHNEGDILDTVFKFKNTGELPLIISKVKTSCGCTTPYWPKKEILPGESELLKIRFNTNHKPGKQTKTITIHSNVRGGKDIIKIKSYNIPKNKEGKEKLKKVNKILNNKIDPKTIYNKK